MFIRNLIFNKKIKKSYTISKNSKGFVFSPYKYLGDLSRVNYTYTPNSNKVNSLLCFKKISNFHINKGYPLPLFYKNYFKLPIINSLNTFIYYGCHKSFENLLRRFFWNIKVTDHKYILLWLRRLLKFIWYRRFFFNLSGITLLVRGKLGVTGNKRRRSFKVNYGSIDSTKKNTIIAYYTIRTLTGVLGVTLSITYNH